MFLWNLSSFASMLCLISNLAFNLFTPTILNCSPLFLDCLRVILDAWSILTHSLCSGKFWEKIHHMLLICGVMPAFLFIYLSFHPGKNSVRCHPTFSGCLTSGILFTDISPSPDVSHPEFCLSTSHLLWMSHTQNSVRRHPTFSECLTSGILSGRRSTFSGYLTFDAWCRMGEEDNPDSLDSLARQTLAIRLIHFCPQSSAPLDFNRHECYFFHNSRIMEFVILIHAI